MGGLTKQFRLYPEISSNILERKGGKRLCVIELEHLCSAPSFNTILAPVLVRCELPVKDGGTRRAIW